MRHFDFLEAVMAFQMLSTMKLYWFFYPLLNLTIKTKLLLILVIDSCYKDERYSFENGHALLLDTLWFPHWYFSLKVQIIEPYTVNLRLLVHTFRVY